jgi:hypothetical protein
LKMFGPGRREVRGTGGEGSRLEPADLLDGDAWVVDSEVTDTDSFIRWPAATTDSLDEREESLVDILGPILEIFFEMDQSFRPLCNCTDIAPSFVAVKRPARRRKLQERTTFLV